MAALIGAQVLAVALAELREKLASLSPEDRDRLATRLAALDDAVAACNEALRLQNDSAISAAHLAAARHPGLREAIAATVLEVLGRFYADDHLHEVVGTWTDAADLARKAAGVGPTLADLAAGLRTTLGDNDFRTVIATMQTLQLIAGWPPAPKLFLSGQDRFYVATDAFAYTRHPALRAGGVVGDYQERIVAAVQTKKVLTAAELWDSVGPKDVLVNPMIRPFGVNSLAVQAPAMAYCAAVAGTIASGRVRYVLGDAFRPSLLSVPATELAAVVLVSAAEAHRQVGEAQRRLRQAATAVGIELAALGGGGAGAP
jgi:hypothetical protein